MERNELIVIQQWLRNTQLMIMEADELDDMMLDGEEMFFFRTYELHFRVEGYTEAWLPRYTEGDFFRAYRMTRLTFTKLLQILCSRGGYEPQTLHGRRPVPAEKRLLLSLRFLASKKTLHELGELYNVVESTACLIVDQTLNFLKELQPQVLKWPNEEEAQTISEEFQEVCGFPGVIGALDGSHIDIKVTKEDRYDYTNRKYKQSVIILAASTYSKLLTYVYIGFPGRAHDARVLQNSSLWNIVQNQGQDLFYNGKFLLCDTAFPLKTWSIVPFRRNENLTDERKRFNQKLSSGRIAIENTFGWLKGRFRRLKYIDVNSLEKVTKIIDACCTVHNFCLIQDDLLPQRFEVPNENMPMEDNFDVPENAAVLKRDALVRLVQ